MKRVYEVGYREIRKALNKGCCPFCGDRRIFKSVASHTVNAHGVSGYELREMAGLNRGSRICLAEYSQECRERTFSRPDAEIARALALGRGLPKEKRDATWRPEGRERQLIDRRSPKRQRLFKTSMAKIIGQRSEIAKRRSPEAIREQTLRVINANERFMSNATAEVISARARYASSFIKPETHKKAAMIAIPIIKELHKQKEWKEKWREHLIKSLQKRAKVPHSDYPLILSRASRGEKLKDIATEYGVTPRFIRRLVTGK